MLQRRFGQAAVARLAQPERARALRYRALDALSLGVEGAVLVRAFPRPCSYVAQQFISSELGLNVGGYYLTQTTNDTVNGRAVFSPNNPFGAPDTLNAGIGNRGEVFAIGPGISYNPYPNIFLNAHWDHELFSYNKQQREQVYARVAFRF